jgi:probable rRNA maturation factor
MAIVSVEDDSGLGIETAQLLAQAEFMMGALGLHQDTELVVTLVGEDEIAQLHEEWLDEPGPTDVLSFPMDELRIAAPGEPAVAGVLGDIVICPQFAARAAQAAGAPLSVELTLLLTHGILHLLGFDHATEDEHVQMFGRQDELIAAWARHGAGGEETV